MAEKRSRTEISTLGEFGLIDHLTKEFKPTQPTTLKGIGDDCAVISTGDKLMVVTTDLLLEGIHFDLTYSPLRHLGYKAVVVNVSDIYAMGDYPFWLYIAQKSKLAYLDEPLATYRIVGGSATNQGYHKQLTFLESLQEVKEFFMEHFTYSEPVRHRVKLEYLQKKLMLCFLTNKKEELYKCAQRLELLKGKLTLRERVYTTMGRSWLLSFPIKLYHNTYHRLRRG